MVTVCPPPISPVVFHSVASSFTVDIFFQCCLPAIGHTTVLNLEPFRLCDAMLCLLFVTKCILILGVFANTFKYKLNIKYIQFRDFQFENSVFKFKYKCVFAPSAATVTACPVLHKDNIS